MSGSAFGDLLRLWRSERHLSQLDLAHAIETPSRHISFLETGRSRPSREMIDRLACALEIPPRERSALLEAAGFTNQLSAVELADDELRIMHEAVTRLMRAQDPYPSFVVDRQWGLIDANTSGRAVLALVDQPLVFDPPNTCLNLIDAAFDPAGFRHYIENWEDYARQFIQRLHRDASCDCHVS